MPFTLVQLDVVAETSAGQDPTITLSPAATSGNLLVVALGHRRSDAAATPTITGTSGLTREYAFTDNTNGNKGVALFWKVAAGGETTFTAAESQQWRYLAVAEFALPAGATGVSWSDHATAVANTAATSLTVNVPAPGTSESLAWVSSFARDSLGTTVTFDSGFASASADADFAVSWRDDAEDVLGGDVQASYTSAFVAVLGSGVWTADGADLEPPSSVTFNADNRTLTGSWTSSAGADDYDWEVQYDNAGTWTAFDSGTTATLSFQLDDTDGVAWDTTYRARVRSDAAGETASAWSSWLTVTVPAEPTTTVPRKVRWDGSWETAAVARQVRWSGAWAEPTV